MFSLELPHRGDFNGYTQYTSVNTKRKITLSLSYSKSAAMGFFPRLKNEVEIVVDNTSSVFETLQFYSIYSCTDNIASASSDV